MMLKTTSGYMRQELTGVWRNLPGEKVRILIFWMKAATLKR
jgi:hypothetical protein